VIVNAQHFLRLEVNRLNILNRLKSPIPNSQVGGASTANETLFLVGLAHTLAGEYVEAIDPLTQAVSHSEADYKSLFARSVSYAALGRFDEALKDALKAADLSQSRDVQLNLANILYLVGHQQRALALCNRILDNQAGKTAAAYQVRGNIQRALGAIGSAAEDYLSAVHLISTNSAQ
jgi:tetratricopeptide (TPR) repeat protein